MWRASRDIRYGVTPYCNKTMPIGGITYRSQRTWTSPYFAETVASKRWFKIARMFQILTIVGAIASAGLFFAGNVEREIVNREVQGLSIRCICAGCSASAGRSLKIS